MELCFGKEENHLFKGEGTLTYIVTNSHNPLVQKWDSTTGYDVDSKETIVK